MLHRYPSQLLLLSLWSQLGTFLALGRRRTDLFCVIVQSFVLGMKSYWLEPVIDSESGSYDDQNS